MPACSHVCRGHGCPLAVSPSSRRDPTAPHGPPAPGHPSRFPTQQSLFCSKPFTVLIHKVPRVAYRRGFLCFSPYLTQNTSSAPSPSHPPYLRPGLALIPFQALTLSWFPQLSTFQRGPRLIHFLCSLRALSSIPTRMQAPQGRDQCLGFHW